MKITRIQRIKNHRVFQDFAWQNDVPDFGRFNLIYGWNGSGKTTLSNLFRHLQDKLDIHEGEIQFVIDGATALGNAISTATLPQIRVFNRDSINRNVFEIPNQQLPPVYFLGEDSVERQRKIEELKQDAIKAAELQLSCENKKLGSNAAYETFCIEGVSGILCKRVFV